MTIGLNSSSIDNNNFTWQDDDLVTRFNDVCKLFISYAQLAFSPPMTSSAKKKTWLLVIMMFSSYHMHIISAFSLPMTSSAKKTLDRRSVLDDIAKSTASLLTVYTIDKQPTRAVAPFAPIDTLLPATRVKITLDNAVDIASKLVADKGLDDSNKKELLHDLESLLLIPQDYMKGTTPIDVPQQPAKSYLKSYEEYRNQVSILEKPGAMLVQNGEIDAWKRLKRQEKAREDTDEIRAALNYYTSNLNFNSDKFVLTASKEERSKMIRDDKIPDVKSVIASDMGLRYLLRNDLLTAVDDARAEVRYQLKQLNNSDASSIDGSDLLELLLTAQSALNKWFDLINKEDTLAALDIVKREN